VCDDRGGLYALKDMSGVADPSRLEWVMVDSGFKAIYAGHHGLVCGTKGDSLYIRRCVNHVTPVGTGWAVHACDILKIVPSKTCVVRKPSEGCLLVARVDFEAEILHWNSLPPYCTQLDKEGSEQLHYVMDDCDRLFAITGNGSVYCCEPLTNDPYWYGVAAPPNLGSTQGIISQLFSNFWSTDAGSNLDWVSMVASGTGCIWCLRAGSREAWQLVIGWVNSVPKVNWNKIELPLSEGESVVSLSSCKSGKGGLYTIVKGDGYFKMVSCFATKGQDRLEMKLPVRYPCWSLAICSTPVIEVSFFLELFIWNFPTRTSPLWRTNGPLN
jgi:hypothetical protein